MKHADFILCNACGFLWCVGVGAYTQIYIMICNNNICVAVSAKIVCTLQHTRWAQHLNASTTAVSMCTLFLRVFVTGFCIERRQRRSKCCVWSKRGELIHRFYLFRFLCSSRFDTASKSDLISTLTALRRLQNGIIYVRRFHSWMSANFRLEMHANNNRTFGEMRDGILDVIDFKSQTMKASRCMHSLCRLD